MAGTYNITIEQGSTFTRSLTMTDSNGDAFNLTGYSARMQIRQTYGSKIIATSEGASPTITLDVTPLDGIIEITMTATETAKLSTLNAIYDLEIEKDGVVTRILEGTVTLSREVTK